MLAAWALGVLEAGWLNIGDGGPEPILHWIAHLAFQVNLLLAVFNMIPVPPLDGGNVLGGLLPATLSNSFDRLLRPYGFLILYALILTDNLMTIIGPPYSFLTWLLRP